MKNLLIIVIAVIAFSGCEKDEVVGPQGPQGVQGEQGNANVESHDFTVFSSSWESFEEGYETIEDWDVLTDEMVNEGGVFVYWLVEDDTYIPLPSTLPAGDGFLSVLSAFRVGEISVSFMQGGGITINNPGIQQFRAIAIAPKSVALGDEHVQKLIEMELKK